ncbi:MAG: tetratricopeptide repeat protein [Chitinophagales bacterium]|nr:tetratricopeptide repeat protein [Chitinophagales bacterium]MCZ2392694.1 tetratricopeptide repeat protein [Chitinophagales bacterium]
MKHYLLIFFMLMFSANSLIANEQDSLFNQAVLKYQQKDYDKAYWLFDGLVQEGNLSFQLFFNYANTCTQLKKYARAIAFYEKALKLSPNESATESNLIFLRKKMALTDESDRHWRNKIGELNMYSLSVLATWAWIILLSVTFLLVSKQNRKIYFFSSVLLFILAVYLIFNSIKLYRVLHVQQFAIVQEESAMYNQPALLSDETYDLFIGQKIEVLDEKNGWLKVNVGLNRKGWMPSERLIEI